MDEKVNKGHAVNTHNSTISAVNGQQWNESPDLTTVTFFSLV